MNLTLPTALLLDALAAGHRYGFDLMDATGLASGTVYPALRRLEGAGCVAARWEDADAAQAEGRPPRRYYALTGEGRARLAEARARYPALRAASPGRAAPGTA